MQITIEYTIAMSSIAVQFVSIQQKHFLFNWKKSQITIQIKLATHENVHKHTSTSITCN